MAASVEHPIAIVGLGGVFPSAPTLDEFIRLILEGTDTSRDVPAGRWIADSKLICSPTLAEDRPYHARGCYIDDFSLDASGLALPADLLGTLDPTFHFALHACRSAFADGRTASIDRDRIGVVLATIALPTDATSSLTRELMGRDFERRLFRSAPKSPSQIIGHTHGINHRVLGLCSGLVCAGLELGGGSFTLDAACASSLYAVKFACDELRAHRADAMLAGGVNRPDCLYTQTGFTQLRALSRSGRCRPFDSNADGLLVGEGAGAVLLKRLDDAVRDGDRIYGVIRGIGLSNDVAGSLLAADSEGQLRAMRQAYKAAGWSPSDVDVIECHGTGTPLGDAVEVNSLRTLWSDEKWSPGQCVLGSVKSNMGHLLTGAGIAGLIKTILAMNAKTLPPTANFQSASKDSKLDGSAFRVISKKLPWDQRDAKTPRRAAVSAFGFGGINGHLLLEEWPKQSARKPKKKPTRSRPRKTEPPIAIVGMSTRLGSIENLDGFAEAVFSGDSVIAQKSDHRWRGLSDRAVDSSLPESLPGAYIDDVRIPIGQFKVPPAEISESLPQQMLMLQVVRDALDDAGFEQSALGERFGCIIGMSLDANASNYHLRWAIPTLARGWANSLGLELSDDEFAAWVVSLQAEASPPLTAGRVVGSLGGMVASRIAREFGIGGPSFTMSADVNSGLRALELGARMLQRGELDGVIVGAVDLPGDVRRVFADRDTYTDGVSVEVLGPRANGTLPGDGAVAIVLKRAVDAHDKKLRSYATLRGFGFAGGQIPGQCSSEAYRSALTRAYHEADVDPATVGLIETAGNGQPDLDRMEVESLCQFVQGDRDRDLSRDARCAIGSLVPTIGFSQAASGLASIVKTALSLFRESVPPLAQFAEPVDEFAKQNHFYIAHECQPWLRNRSEGPRRAGVSSMSLHGECAHAILEEADHASEYNRVSARMMPLAESNSRDRASSDAIKGGKLAFIYPGSGVHWVGMGRQLMLDWPGVVQQLDAAFENLADQFLPQWAMPRRSEYGEGWRRRASVELSGDARRTILSQVSFGALMTDILKAMGIQPDAAIGYSLGETTSLISLGAWSDRDEMAKRLMRSSLFASDLAGDCDAATRHWKMSSGEKVAWSVCAVNRSSHEVRKALAKFDRAYLLIVNAPGECVIGGQRDQVDAIKRALGCDGVELSGAPAVHCSVVDEVRDAYHTLHLSKTTPPEGVGFYSAAWAKAYEVTRESAADSITAQATDGFDFPKVIEQAYADGVRYFVEVGPRATCTRMIRRILGDRPHFAESASGAADDERAALMNLVASLSAHGISINRGALGAPPESSNRTEADAHRRVVRVPTGGRPFDPPMPEADETRTSEAATSRIEIAGNVSKVSDNGTQQKEHAAVKEAVLVSEHDHAVASHADFAERTAVGGSNVAGPQEAVQDELMASMQRANLATSKAHDAFLRFSQAAMTDLSDAIALRQSLLGSGSTVDLPAMREPVSETQTQEKGTDTARVAAVASPPRSIAFDRDLCMEFAIGSVANVLGPKFAEVDAHSVRVRLPDEPLMLVDRIVSIEGEVCSLGGGRIVTEHDVKPDDWYLDGGKMPISITVESGQADLFLCSYLGIDHAVKGTRSYRLLDAAVRFHRGLPEPGEVVSYDIRIERFVQQGETYLFFFSFEGSIAGVPLLSMADGCAGFFTDEEIKNSGGIVETTQEKSPSKGERLDGLEELVACNGVEKYDDAQVEALRSGDLVRCFGEAFADLPLNNPIRLPSGRMRLVHRVTELNTAGGRFGKGIIRAEADIHPDDWFLTCHFVDDMVMPGTLMYDCCVQTLRIFLMRIGWVAEHDTVCHEPVVGISSALKCRGPVTQSTKMVTYELHIKKMGYNPEPYVIADALMFGDGEKIVRFTDLSLRITGTSREQLEKLWASSKPVASAEAAGIVPIGDVAVSSDRKPAIYSYEQIFAFAVGKPSEAFGDRYEVFDNDRKIARLPGPPFQFLDRVTEVHAKPWLLNSDGWIETQYDVPPDAWYFGANRQRSMPFAVLLEIALQPCGWLAAYKGSALSSETDLAFRNLDGEATLVEEVFPDAGLLIVRARMTQVSQAGGMLIQKYDMQVWCESRIVYDGNTTFGFFTRDALARQVGITDAANKRYKATAAEVARAKPLQLESCAPWSPDESVPSPIAGGGAIQPGKAFQMIDRIDLYVPDGGSAGLGFVSGSKDVVPDEWFFAAHFYQDPVCPGSLGLESMLQLLKVVAVERFGAEVASTHRFTPMVVGARHIWSYRGQVIPANRRVEVEVVVTSIVPGPNPTIVADGWLSVDGVTIYEMKDFGLTLAREVLA
ncbi:MAG: acyltransferase domain-containing protein [Planctomycetes bacterium]|nr:acyltransferase domain-containing protein [Planctomycetota bacterium]